MSEQKTKKCFVIIGYGDKVDLASQRHLNLDRVFENIIKPAFDSFRDPAFDCFRAIDKNFGGVIDVEMYKWIYEAEFVVADISTLNPNAIYELGVRHALRPYSTLVIAEDGIQNLPFDVSHVKIEKYRHLGEDIGATEARRVTEILKTRIKEMLNNQINDSPVYTFIQKLKPPYFEKEEDVSRTDAALKTITGETTLPAINILQNDISLTELLRKAESELRARNFEEALKLFKQAEERDQSNTYLKQKIILATYKTATPDKETALLNALSLFNRYFNLDNTIDRAVLEQGATINRKLAQIEYEKGSLCIIEKAKSFAYKAVKAFEKAYVLSDSFFIGSSYADALLIAAVLEEQTKEKYHFFLRSNLAWRQVYETAMKMIDEHKNDKSKWKDKRVLLEKIVQASLVLKNGIEDTEVVDIKQQLITMQSEYQQKGFVERIQKSVGYVTQVRNSLKNMDRKDMFFVNSIDAVMQAIEKVTCCFLLPTK